MKEVPAWKVYTVPIRKELQVHALEDAGVVINYRPDLDKATEDARHATSDGNGGSGLLPVDCKNLSNLHTQACTSPTTYDTSKTIGTGPHFVDTLDVVHRGFTDKTRIIGILDELQDKGLIERVPDPEDRRARLLAITKDGRRVKEKTQAAIQRGEERWLGTLSASDRATFLRVLQELSGVDWS